MNNPTSTQYTPGSVRYELSQSLSSASRPKSYNEMFDVYKQQKAAERSAATRAEDPYLADLDRQESEARQALDGYNRNAIDDLRQNVQKHTVDPKRQRWSAIASAATDAVSGIAGMIGVANGAVHPASLSSIPSASKVTSDHYDNERKLRQEALAKVHDADIRRYKQILADVESNRKKYYDKLQRERERKKQEYLDAMHPYQLSEAQAKARAAELDASYKQARNDAYPALTQSQIARNNRSNTGSPSGEKAKTSLSGFSSRWSYHQ